MSTDLFYELANADCLDYMAHMPDGRVDMILCDLPYGTTQNKWDSIIPLDKLWKLYIEIAKPSTAVVLMAAQPFTSRLIMSNLENFKYTWIWEKSHTRGFLNAWKQPLRKTEDIVVFYREQCLYNPQIVDKLKDNIRPISDRTKGSTNYGIHGLTAHKCAPNKSMPTNILKFNVQQRPIHPTQKPVGLMEYLIKTYTNEGMTVLDNCMGSGTTGVACKNLKRSFIGVEKDETYFKIAKERIEKCNPTSL